jgi:hypothetical protein
VELPRAVRTGRQEEMSNSAVVAQKSVWSQNRLAGAERALPPPLLRRRRARAALHVPRVRLKEHEPLPPAAPAEPWNMGGRRRALRKPRPEKFRLAAPRQSDAALVESFGRVQRIKRAMVKDASAS